jgi:hypothetical protein
MLKLRLLAPALAGLFAVSNAFAQYADSVVAYNPGTGFVPGFTSAASALDEPSRVTPGDWGGVVDPFNPPWLSSQVVSIGANGSLTVRFNTPIRNNPANPYGVDFMIFGNSGFYDTSWPSGITDGSLLGDNTGSTRVSVSTDGLTFYTLDPRLAPVVDGMFPTDGSGDFLQPVNPALTGADFAGKNLTGIRALYAGSGGGTGFDLAWVRDGNGQSVSLQSVYFVRVDVLSGASEIDGFAAVPEPAAGMLLCAGAGLLLLANRRKA